MAQSVEELLHKLWKSRVGFPIGFPDFINNSCLTMVLGSNTKFNRNPVHSFCQKMGRQTGRLYSLCIISAYFRQKRITVTIFAWNVTKRTCCGVRGGAVG